MHIYTLNLLYFSDLNTAVILRFGPHALTTRFDSRAFTTRFGPRAFGNSFWFTCVYRLFRFTSGQDTLKVFKVSFW